MKFKKGIKHGAVECEESNCIAIIRFKAIWEDFCVSAVMFVYIALRK